MYQYENRISYCMIGNKGTLKIPSLIDLFQDSSLFHSHDAGYSLDYLDEVHRAWLVNNWHVIVKRMPKMGERVIIKTWPYQFKAVYGRRNYVLQTMDGEVLAIGDAHWFLFDSEKGLPVVPEPSDISNYEVEEKLDMEYKPRKVRYPDDLTFQETVNVYQNLTDTNKHINNGEYIRVATNYLPLDYPVCDVRIEYRNSAHIGDTLYIYTAKNEEYHYVVLCNEEKVPYAIAEYKKGSQE